MKAPRPARLPISGDMRQFADTALWNAHYHFTRIKELAEAAGNISMWQYDSSLTAEQREPLQRDVNLYAACLRASFWELISVFDILERWAKAERRNPHTSDAGCVSTVLAALSSAKSQGWYQSLSAYRNFSHEGMIPMLAVFSTETKKLLPGGHILPGAPGGMQQHVIDHLIQCGEEMKKLVKLAQSCK